MTLQLIALALAANFAQAKPVTISARNCVDADITRAHLAITDYTNYSQLPGATLVQDIPLPGVKPIPMLKMIQSDPQYFDTANKDKETNAYVVVKLQPSNLGKKDDAYFPRLVLHCTSLFDSDTHFRHVCEMVDAADHFGLKGFNSLLNVTANSSACKNGQTLLDYTLVLTGDSAEIDKIKKRVTGRFGPVIGPIIEAFFNEDRFFRDYYENFYKSWVDSL